MWRILLFVVISIFVSRHFLLLGRCRAHFTALLMDLDGALGGGRWMNNQSVSEALGGRCLLSIYIGPAPPCEGGERGRKLSAGRRDGTSGRRCCRQAHINYSATRTAPLRLYPPLSAPWHPPPLCVTRTGDGSGCCVGASWRRHSRWAAGRRTPSIRCRKPPCFPWRTRRCSAWTARSRTRPRQSSMTTRR